jgi:hypothetical protein
MIKHLYLFYKAEGKSKLLLAMLLLSVGLMLEGMALWYLYDQLFTMALFFHLCSSTTLPWPLWYLIPKRDAGSKVFLLLLFLYCLFIPVISGISLFLILTLGLLYAKPMHKQMIDVNALPHAPENILEKISVTQHNPGKIHGVLKSSGNIEQRFRAVLATRQMRDNKAIPILQIGLRDPVDEVRLLAYSMLDRKEKKIDLKIHESLLDLSNEKQNPTAAAVIHQTLAESYWELSYLLLVQGQAQIHTLKSAYHHAYEALKVRGTNAGLNLLHARLALNLDLYEEAARALDQAEKHGMPVVKLAPWRAELAFATRRFEEVTWHVESIDEMAKNNSILAGIFKQWA